MGHLVLNRTEYNFVLSRSGLTINCDGIRSNMATLKLFDFHTMQFGSQIFYSTTSKDPSMTSFL